MIRERSMERWHLWWGFLAILAGMLWLVDAIVERTIPGPVWAAIFLGTGAVFVYGFVLSRQNWWAAIPAGALLGLGGLITWAEITADPAETWGASLFLGILALGFVTVYARTPENWWAIIPGGTLLSLAAMIAVSTSVGDMATVAVFFAGLALTFAALLLIHVDGHRMRWPIPVAGVLALMGTLFALDATTLLHAWNYIWPVALIGYGIYLVVRNMTHGHGPTSGTTT